MKKAILGFMVVLLIGFGVYYKNEIVKPLSHDNVAGSRPVVRIGAILPLTGNNAQFGEELMEGLMLAKDNIDTNVKYELIIEDDQRNLPYTVSIANRMVNFDKVDFIITAGSQSAHAVAPIANKAGVYHFSTAVDISFTEKEYNYAVTPDAYDDVKIVMDNIIKQGYSKVALVSENEAYGNLVERDFNSIAPKLGLTITDNVKVNPGSQDFKMLISKIEANNPDVYFLQMWIPALDIFTKQLHEAYPNKPITGAYSFLMSKNLPLYEGMYALDTYLPTKYFQDIFYKKYNRYPSQKSAISFAILDLIIKSVAQNEEYKKPDVFISSLKEVASKDSVMGDLTVKNRAVHYKSMLIKITNGKSVAVEK